MYNLIKKHVEKIKNKIYSPLTILVIALIIVHLAIILNYGDDIQFSTVLKENNIFQWTFTRYQTWSSRIVVDFIMAFVLGVGPFLWKIIDIAMIILLAVSIPKLFVKNKNNYWIVVALLALYPFNDMRSAGWGATTINYLWPIALGLYSLIICKKIVNNESIQKYEYVFSILATLYACSIEQMCGILVGTYFIIALYISTKKKINWYIILSLIISLMSLVIILLCPGNSIRKSQEMVTYFNDFNQLSFFSKVELGFSSSIAKFVFEPNFVFIVVTLLLGILVLIKSNDLKKRIIGFVPFMSAIFIGIGCFVLNIIFPNCPNIIKSMTKYGIIDLWNYNKISSYLPLLVLIVIVLCTLISMYYCFGKTIKTLLTLFIFLIGLASRVIVGFSPTIWASNDRTFIFMYFSMIIVGIMLYEEIYESKVEIVKYIKKFIIILAIISFVKLLSFLAIAGIFINKKNLFYFIKSKFHIDNINIPLS